MFTLTSAHLETLCVANEFPADRKAMVFFGLRGCLPIDPQDHAFRPQQALVVAEIDYTHPRCTLGQWRPQEGTFAIYPGSTVPHRTYVAKARANGGKGTNQLLTGFYPDYRKGFHRADTPFGHPAFRQSLTRPYQRTIDDLDYDTDDQVEFDNPGDNFHAAFCAGTETAHYASAGCQVVVGYPKCKAYGARGSVGPWRAFHEAAYSLPAQNWFGYVLLHGREALRVTLAAPDADLRRVRFGSRGDRALQVQRALAERDLYEGKLDGDFGTRSLRALLAFQRQSFGPGGADGICGPQTFAALAVK